MIKITIDQNELHKLTSMFSKGSKALSDFSQPFNEFGKLLSQEQKKNFDQQGAIYQGGDFIRTGMKVTTRGSAWKRLADSTKTDRVRQGYNGARPILVRSGKLKSGFKNTVGKLKFTTENTSKIGAYHQEGGRKLPQRRIIGMSQKGTQALQMSIENYLIKMFNMSGIKGFAKFK